MIEIIARNGPPEAMLCPAFVCDACRKQVVGAGNVVYMRRIVGDRRCRPPIIAPTESGTSTAATPSATTPCGA